MAVTGNSRPQLFLHHQLQVKLYTKVLFLCVNYYYVQHPQFKMNGNIQRVSSHSLKL